MTGVQTCALPILKLEKLRLDSATESANFKVIAPIKLAAYERLVLFLERTSPDEILNREIENNMSNFELQVKLLRVIRGRVRTQCSSADICYPKGVAGCSRCQKRHPTTHQYMCYTGE